MTLLGANGAGKTTTLKTISGLVRAKAGRVLFEGQDITAMPAHVIARSGVVHVPEGRHVLRGLSVRENLELGAFTVRDAGIRKERLEQVFAQFPILKTRANSDGSLLSGGEQQMLAVSRAMMSRPKLLLCDEPSLGLSPKLVGELFASLEAINKEWDMGMLIVEQNAAIALSIATRGYLLEVGSITRSGDADTLSDSDAVRAAYLGY